MMCKGFIVDATFASDLDDSDLQPTDIRVEDVQADDPNEIIRVYITANKSNLWFSRKQAKAFVETMNEIIDRYAPTNETSEN